MDLPSVAQETERPCLSTGHPPAPEDVRKHLTGARRQFRHTIHPKTPAARRRPRSHLRSVNDRNEGDT